MHSNEIVKDTGEETPGTGKLNNTGSLTHVAWLSESRILGVGSKDLPLRRINSLAGLIDYTMISFWDAYAETEASAFYDIATAHPIDIQVGTTVVSYPECVGSEAFEAHHY